VKADAKSQQTRARYLLHLAAMFQLLGDSPAAAQAEARTVMAISKPHWPRRAHARG